MRDEEENQRQEYHLQMVKTLLLGGAAAVFVIAVSIALLLSDQKAGLLHELVPLFTAILGVLAGVGVANKGRRRR